MMKNNPPRPSVRCAPAFRKMALGCLLPMVVISFCAAEEAQPPVVDPGQPGAPPSDAIVLFDGRDLSKFRGKNSDQPKWTLIDAVMETIPGGDANGMFSREEFGDCQVHVEWASPTVLKGEGQTRGNSGVYLMGRYEIQVLDSYNNAANPTSQCGAFYGHNPPLVNASRKPGEWQTYDILFKAPRKQADGKVQAGSLTVLHNGILIQHNLPVSEASTAAAPLSGYAEQGPLYLQEHGCRVRFRNVWVRKLNL